MNLTPREIAPPRFRTKEDGELFMQCIASRKAFPPEKWIHPYVVVNGVATISKEYEEAPYQISYIMGPTERLVDA